MSSIPRSDYGLHQDEIFFLQENKSTYRISSETANLHLTYGRSIVQKSLYLIILSKKQTSFSKTVSIMDASIRSFFFQFFFY